MNHDHIILAMLILGGFVGFCFGYSKGHEHGKIAGRIAVRKAERALEAERRISAAHQVQAIKAWDSK